MDPIRAVSAAFEEIARETTDDDDSIRYTSRNVPILETQRVKKKKAKSTDAPVKPAMGQLEQLKFDFAQMVMSDYEPQQRTQEIQQQMAREFVKKSVSRKKKKPVPLHPDSTRLELLLAYLTLEDRPDDAPKLANQAKEEGLAFWDKQTRALARVFFDFFKQPSRHSTQFARLFAIIMQHIDADSVIESPIVGKSTTCAINLSKTKKGATSHLVFVYGPELDPPTSEPDDWEYTLASEWSTFIVNFFVICKLRVLFEPHMHTINAECADLTHCVECPSFRAAFVSILRQLRAAFQYFNSFLTEYDPVYAYKLRQSTSPLWYQPEEQ